MFGHHPAFKAAAALGVLGPLDPPKQPAPKAQPVLDSAESDARAMFALTDIRLAAVASVQAWVETDDLDEGESMADRLVTMLVGIADENKDGEITEDEDAVITMAMEAAFDYMLTKGAAEDDVLAVLNECDAEAAGRVIEKLKSTLPDGEEASLAELDEFVFDADATEPMLDTADVVLDAVYKKRIVVRGGRKVRINKRVAGRVVLSGKQKVAIRKARRRAHSSAAKMRRARSMKMRRRSGM